CKTEQHHTDADVSHEGEARLDPAPGQSAGRHAPDAGTQPYHGAEQADVQIVEPHLRLGEKDHVEHHERAEELENSDAADGKSEAALVAKAPQACDDLAPRIDAERPLAA